MIYHQYWFNLAVISLGILLLERVAPWRRKQPLFRPQLGQDVFWLIFNGFCFGYVSAFLYAWICEIDCRVCSLLMQAPVDHAALIEPLPLWAQIPIFLVAADLIEYGVHRLLHRVGWLWRFHRLHHSIRVMDWIGNFRFHWVEVLVYNTVKYVPLSLLGASWQAILIVATIATAVGHLNHANLNISWGPFRFLFNSPRMHIWHHDVELHGRWGQNYAIVFSLWDWLFGTAYFPESPRQPERIGFDGDEAFPDSLARRFVLPFLDVTNRSS
jgi:sterol desaturase/sphingolipid hydroxylase (fatty acid hydroxylase superfamily)